MRGATPNDKGFSLIEVMVSLALGVVIVMLVVQLFINAKNNHAQNNRVSETLESGRYALRQLTTDLKEAGFLGGITDPSSVSQDTTLPNLGTDCGTSSETSWAYDLTTYRALQFDDSTTSTANHTCINATSFYVPPTTQSTSENDILAIKRVATTPLTTGTTINPALTNNTVYLRSDYTKGCLWYYDSASSPNPKSSNCPAAGTTVNDWQYSVNVYYIRDYYQTQGDGTPTFCRESLVGTSMTNVCLAPGVERFHVMFGIDTDGDGVANEYKSTGLTQSDMDRAVSARVYVLARSLQQDSTLQNNQTFTLGDETVKTTDKYYRRLYSTTVMLRNPMYGIKFQ